VIKRDGGSVGALPLPSLCLLALTIPSNDQGGQKALAWIESQYANAGCRRALKGCRLHFYATISAREIVLRHSSVMLGSTSVSPSMCVREYVQSCARHVVDDDDGSGGEIRSIKIEDARIFAKSRLRA
jgi:hypothetical protein